MSSVVLLPRLRELDFSVNPFRMVVAEEMDAAFLEETFVELPHLNELMSLERSAVMLAPRGSGKTNTLLKLKAELQERQKNHFEGVPNILAKVPAVPLVVSYDNFNQLYRLSTPITQEDHLQPLMAAIARALAECIEAYSAHFKNQDASVQHWYGEFLATFLRFAPLIEALQEMMPALKGYQEARQLASSRWGNSLYDLLEELEVRLRRFGFDRVVILVDKVDNYQQSTERMANLILPILKDQDMYRLPFFTWKFFLLSALEAVVTESAGRQGSRFDQIPIEWNEESLKELLIRRISIEAVCQQDLFVQVDVKAQLARFARWHKVLGPPRALLELAQELFREEAGEEREDKRLSLADWDRFVERIAEQLVPEGETIPERNPEPDQPERIEIQPEEQDLDAIVAYWRNHKPELRKKLGRLFSMDELDGLRSDLNIEEGEIGGDNKGKKATLLIEYLERRGRLAELIKILPKERPNEDWKPPPA
jgi:hypothetical protein